MSCEQDELIAPDPVSASKVSASNAIISSDGRPNLLSEALFEPSLSSYFRKQVYTTYGFTSSNDFVRNGANAARFEMRNGDGSVRSEILLPAETESNRWYGTSLYLPSDSWESDYNAEGWDIISQWHAVEDAGEDARLPPLSLTVAKGRLSFVINWATEATNTNGSVSGKKVFDLGPVEKDKWLDMVYHINFSHESDGVLEVWKNGVKVVDYKGPNCYNDQVYPYFKAGIYKRRWYDVTKRVLYIDEVRTGNSDATYKDVAPTGTINPLTSMPITSASSSYLVQPVKISWLNANTNQLLKTITNGDTLDLANINTSNLNIAAITSNSPDSVKFNLTGTKTQNVTQTGAPYALYGYTNGNPNSWTPAIGSYTLTVTTYSTSGTNTSSVKFTVVNNATDGTGTPVASIVINDNASVTYSNQATLTIKAVNATHMRFYDNANSTWTNWEPIAATRPWTLSSGAGSKWVKVQVKNVMGIMSATASDGITLK
ncbi:polysaccharide lyase [Adhaeribacter radiodurans]|uniref:Heparin lyase I family protein n=1 Tax=Adhaeribacter radiodurans TaxID=2745197 RepID=A0A7L7L5J4_9BACT|nr:polysaccharide lyase [Adhaeribacter radiodurans]QMU27659.1 heparin lyase I family protein [Adhaeribacter radiodurans]